MKRMLIKKEASSKRTRNRSAAMMILNNYTTAQLRQNKKGVGVIIVNNG